MVKKYILLRIMLTTLLLVGFVVAQELSTSSLVITDKKTGEKIVYQEKIRFTSTQIDKEIKDLETKISDEISFYPMCVDDCPNRCIAEGNKDKGCVEECSIICLAYYEMAVADYTKKLNELKAIKSK